MLLFNLLMITTQKYPLPTITFCKYAIIPRKRTFFLFPLFPFSSIVLYASIKLFSHDKSQRECVSFPRILVLIALFARDFTIILLHFNCFNGYAVSSKHCGRRQEITSAQHCILVPGTNIAHGFTGFLKSCQKFWDIHAEVQVLGILCA